MSCSIALANAATLFPRNGCERGAGSQPCRPPKVDKKEGEPETNQTSVPAPGPHNLSFPRRPCYFSRRHRLAFLSNAINQRQEKYEDVEIYVVDLGARRQTQPRRITKNQGVESNFAGPTTIAISCSKSK